MPLVGAALVALVMVGPEAAQVRRDEAPPFGHALELRAPHVRVERKRVNEKQRPAGARFEVARRSAVDVDGVFTNHGLI